MAVVVTHAFTSPISDAGDPNIVGPDEWNANHTVTGLATVASTGAASDLSGYLAGREVVTSDRTYYVNVSTGSAQGAAQKQGEGQAKEDHHGKAIAEIAKHVTAPRKVTKVTNKDGSTSWIAESVH